MLSPLTIYVLLCTELPDTFSKNVLKCPPFHAEKWSVSLIEMECFVLRNKVFHRPETLCSKG